MRIRTEEQIVWSMQRNSTDDDPSGIKGELAAMRRRVSALQLENLKDKARITCYAEPMIPTNVKAVAVVMVLFVFACCLFIK